MPQRIALAEDDLDSHEKRILAMDEKLVAAVDQLGEKLDAAGATFSERVGSLETALRNAALTVLAGVAITVLGGVVLAGVLMAFSL